ncbi:TetR/AcrR family transcriptional regulator [Algibacter amylolyticus]|uniref:TetR/AcrR family transcriptional regulator n=1 Tax=Algibacter amylolyticus TaxID=1608400 RepID=A0A5M7BES6_9FLAO|nr:TetR/AcrR family transcriptional regulator [Algibacter amylolyticus]KAA5825685.1 TetR/AcrR family transcriptional regulator [Algibacter amylolyticus]MBB5268082.1 AcrR family transcriptional regulator [Algibacter amylolyticus]TSJ79983.1 TetR/AcrR family transcriptional regulator [Algibacter amylolyticus]
MKKAESTRLTILQKAFELIYTKSYQTTSIDDIIATTQVTKGAFYYHFKTKDKMGVAIINEILKPRFTNNFIQPLQKEENPLEAIYYLMDNLLMKNEFLKVEYGCPASNFTQEMTPWNTDFNIALNELTQEWIKVMTAIIEKGKENKFVRNNVNAKQVTMFIMSGYWGIRNFGKLENSKKPYLSYLKQLKNYLNSLK